MSTNTKGRKILSSSLLLPVAGIGLTAALGVGMSIGVSGGWLTSTTNDFTASSVLPVFSQGTVDDLAGTNPGATVTSSVGGTVTAQLSGAFGDLAPNEPVTTTYLQFTNTTATATDINLNVEFTGLTVKDAAGVTVTNQADIDAVLGNYNVVVAGQQGADAITSTSTTLLAATPITVTNSVTALPAVIAQNGTLVLSFSGDTNDAIPAQYAGWSIAATVTITASAV